MKTKAVYPVDVKERALEVYNGLRDAGYVIDIDESLLFENICKFFLDKWLAGDPMEISEDEANDIYMESGLNGAFDDLIRQGYMNSIEDENGQEIIWLTDKGKAELN